jgi:hypothetical protein
MAGFDLIRGIHDSFLALKGHKWKAAVYLPMMVILTTFFSLGGTALVCFIPILVTVVLFGVPYWLGERRIRTMALVGLAVVLLSSVLLAAISLGGAYDLPTALQSSNEEYPVLYAGRVEPKMGDAGTLFTYTVWVQMPEDPADVTVYVNVTSISDFSFTSNPRVMAAVDSGDTDLSNGKAYELRTTLDPGRHFFHFAAEVNGTWTETSTYDPVFGEIVETYGPVNQAPESFFVFALTIFFLRVLLVAALFYLVLLMYWWVKRGWTMREGRRKELVRVKGAYECTNCGGDVPEDAEVCPACGATFEEEE